MNKKYILNYFLEVKQFLAHLKQVGAYGLHRGFFAKKYPNCFYVWGIGNILFLLYAALINSVLCFFMSVFTLGMNIYGRYQWNKN